MVAATGPIVPPLTIGPYAVVIVVPLQTPRDHPADAHHAQPRYPTRVASIAGIMPDVRPIVQGVTGMGVV